ncbi:hypothetical protein RRF57_012095 [Xylaria bambusicola]|uniref:Uncharacterized protein n=1 Tax=Xylaria bambusicola TaxID=326684 RepID=A0AAN7ZEJ0_9PEZI
MLQTVQDYPRWDEEEALLRYMLLDYNKLYTQFRDIRAAPGTQLGSARTPLLGTCIAFPMAKRSLRTS